MNKKLLKEIDFIQGLISSQEYDNALKEIEGSQKIRGTLYEGVFLIWIGSNTLSNQLLNKGIKVTEKNICKEGIDPDNKIQAHYNLGNGYSSLYEIALSSGEDLYSIEKLWKKAVKNYRSVPYDHDFYSIAQTNLANTMDHVGRPIEAIAHYEEALKKDSSHAMAAANLALAMENMAGISDYSNAYLIYSYQTYNRALADKESILKIGGQKAYDMFVSHRDKIKSFFENNGQSKLLLLDLTHPYRDDSTQSDSVRFYTNFCIEHDLYLNLHLHDRNSDASVGDPIVVKPITSIKDNKSTQEMFFRLNEIKESYMTARYLLVQSQYTHKETSDISNQTTLINNADYSASNLYVGLLKSSYKESIGVLDKIAILINFYLKLGHKENDPKLDYRKVWYSGLDKTQGINTKVVKRGGRYLYGAKSLCDEIASLDKGIRNSLTHRYLRIYRVISGPPDTYTFEELVDKTIKIHYLVKCTIISLANFINQVEGNKLHAAKMSGKIVPPMPMWSDQMLDVW